MKTLEFLYQEAEIHFLVNGTDKNVMVNATEMAKIFDKKVEPFMRNENTKAFVKSCLKSENSSFISVNSESDLIDSRQKSGTYMHEILALKFAAWLDPDFEFWVFNTIRSITFGNYRKHWEAHASQEEARERMRLAKQRLLENPDKDQVAAYFEAESDFQAAKKAKTRAIRNQLRLFDR